MHLHSMLPLYPTSQKFVPFLSGKNLFKNVVLESQLICLSKLNNKTNSPYGVMLILSPFLL